MSKPPYFSVILPTYNRASMFPRAVESLLQQTFTDWELIVVDDGSTDHTKEVMGGYHDPRIQYVYQEHRERSAARNKGISEAKGKYICFLDSDDFYLPQHLECFYEKINNCNEPIAFFYCELFHEANEILFLPEEGSYQYSTNIEFVIQNIIGPPQVCIHSDILRTYHFNEELNVGEDLNLWMRIMMIYPLIKTDRRTLVVRLHEGRTVNLLVTNTYKKHLRSFLMTLKKDPKIKKMVAPNLRRTFISECYLGMARYYLLQRMKRRAGSAILISLCYRFFYQLKLKLNLLYCMYFNYEKALSIIKRPNE